MGRPSQTIDIVLQNNLCIGCGLCAAACPHNTIKMGWHSKRTWQPALDKSKCTKCGLCYEVCPHSPECIIEYSQAAAESGRKFGLPHGADYFISYDMDESKRILSASGGALSVLLGHLLESGVIDGVVASVPLFTEIGKPHYQVQIFHSKQELETGRSSHYHPLNYDAAIRELSGMKGSFAILGVPCIVRGLKRLPQKIRQKIRFTIALCCSHNVTGAFIDCLAAKEGIGKNEPFQANLREKKGIPDANNFNTYFCLEQREIRRNRFESAFTDMWRNYFFAQECCLYCPDFYGVDADLSVKDAWGRLSKDPLGISLLVIRNKELSRHLTQLRETGRLYLEECRADEVFDSQKETPVFKHEGVHHRLAWKKIIRADMRRKNIPHIAKDWSSRESVEYWRFRAFIWLSNFFYFNFGRVPVKRLLDMVRPRKKPNTINSSRPAGPASSGARSDAWQGAENPNVLIAGGYGYGNVGDEAQLAANIQHWKKAFPSCRITVLTPYPEYTRATHRKDIIIELAPRVSLFGAGDVPYFGSEEIFKKKFFPLALRFLLNAYLIRAGLPAVGLTARQARMLNVLRGSDVLFLSGGGYLTGMTLSRLWENMLLLRLARIFGVPAFLSGQTIGVFQNRLNRFLAKWGLKTAELIYLRDPVSSSKALAEIGITAERTKSTFDDALFYSPESQERIDDFLKGHGLYEKPYLAVNVHYWGQAPEESRVIIKQTASALDRIQSVLGLRAVFVAMHASDEAAVDETLRLMQNPGIFPKCGYDLDLTIGLIQNATLCLTMKHHPIIFAMAAGVPTVSMCFDGYYEHKNRGAQDIFGQGKYVIAGCEELSIKIEESVTEVYRRRTELSAQIRSKVEELRPLAGDVIYKYKSALHSKRIP
ncbi:MAG TPA: hypothetical protein DDW94_07010 [Deltaproteobacteria bacterium]|nr:hypothetical protein [Deltaproteobacteria bacterium]HCY11268.1 hypothetical protein [Deltaproteobacteria bacterium]